jgi:RNA polymerase sigma-70 factor, ECF subfamily
MRQTSGNLPPPPSGKWTLLEPFLAVGIPLDINVVVPACEQLPVEEARAGSPEAWDILFKRYQLPLYVYVFELVHDEQASLDIVQETFIGAVRHIRGLRDDGKFGSWLFGIAHQKCIQRWRARKREEAWREEIAVTPLAFDESPLDVVVRQEQEAEFMMLLNKLPPPQRSVLLLHFLEDFSLEEIADITAAQLGTVKSRIHYAKRALRKLLEENV